MDTDTFALDRGKGCKRCYDATDRQVRMRPTETYDPSQGCYVAVWQCPECDRLVRRADGDGVGLRTPQGERF